jgi:hypothetical protein
MIRTGWLRHMWLLGALLLAGCNGLSQDPLTYSLTVADDESVFVAPALDATVRHFIGPQPERPGPAESTQLGNISRDSLSPQSDTPFYRQPSQRYLMTLQYQTPISKTVSSQTRLSIGQGSSRYVLPQGSGILGDPITIVFNTQFATIETGLAWHAKLARNRSVDVSAGTGLHLVTADTRITSALLDVAHTSTSRHGFYAVRAGLSGPVLAASPARIAVEAEVLAYPGQSATIGWRLSAQY